MDKYSLSLGGSGGWGLVSRNGSENGKWDQTQGPLKGDIRLAADVGLGSKEWGITGGSEFCGLSPGLGQCSLLQVGGRLRFYSGRCPLDLQGGAG